MHSTLRSYFLALPAVAALLTWPAAQAQFAAAVNPPRFEIEAKAGQTVRQVLEVTHAGAGTGMYRVYTTDWTMDDKGAVTFYDTVQPGSCRPWVAIERREISVPRGARVRYRFEVSPPPNAPAGECRFALMIESKPQELQAGETAFPMSGRIAVIVYVAVGGVRAELVPIGGEMGEFDGSVVPILTVRNEGNATARLSGYLKAVDAAGKQVELAPEAVPILPGQTRKIALQVYEPPPKPGSLQAAPRKVTFSYPLTVRGVMEFGLPGSAGAGRVELDRAFNGR